jgi:hypothetical protein
MEEKFLIKYTGLIVKMVNSPGIERTTAAQHAVDFVPLSQQ